jgi:hypothetical protein
LRLDVQAFLGSVVGDNQDVGKVVHGIEGGNASLQTHP